MENGGPKFFFFCQYKYWLNLPHFQSLAHSATTGLWFLLHVLPRCKQFPRLKLIPAHYLKFIPACYPCLYINMANLPTSTIIINNNNINNKMASTSTQNAQCTHSTQTPIYTVDPDDYDPSYNLNRFLTDQNYPPGYKKGRSPEEAEKEAKQNKEAELKDFDIKFATVKDSSRS
ncbi:hypothetical protein V8C40DRAFT_248241 [Trichoderma camerunense]